MLDQHADIKRRRNNDDEYNDCLQIHNVDQKAEVIRLPLGDCAIVQNRRR